MDEILNLIKDNPEVVSALIKGSIEKYKPFIYEVGGVLLDIYKDFAANTEIADTSALRYRNKYNAYVKQGFTEDQAMSLLLTNIRSEATLVKSVCNSGNTLPKGE